MTLAPIPIGHNKKTNLLMEDDLVYLSLVDLRVAKDLLHGLETAAEEVLAELFETGTSEGGVEVDTLGKGVDLDDGLCSR